MSATWPVPPLDIRRVVTGHDGAGRAVVVHDGPAHPPDVNPRAPHIRGASIWVTTETPSRDNVGAFNDGSVRAVDGPFGLANAKGANVRTTELAPGTTTPMHRTSSIDYNILISGEVILILDNGSEHHLKTPGDTVVQRGTIHAWRNPGTEWSRWISVLVAAEPAIVDEKALEAFMEGVDPSADSA